MQFDNQKTRNVADVVAKILAGESAKQEPQMLGEELVGNQHKIDANKNKKIDAHDFKMLRAQKDKEKANSQKFGKDVKEDVEELDEESVHKKVASYLLKSFGHPMGGPNARYTDHQLKKGYAKVAPEGTKINSRLVHRHVDDQTGRNFFAQFKMPDHSPEQLAKMSPAQRAAVERMKSHISRDKMKEDVEELDEVMGMYTHYVVKHPKTDKIVHYEVEFNTSGNSEMENRSILRKRYPDHKVISMDHKNKKIDPKMVKEETELAESHFKVGDKVRCKESGMDGKIIKLDKEDGGEDEKYYTFKREDGKVMKKAPNELSKINEEALLTQEEFDQLNELLMHENIEINEDTMTHITLKKAPGTEGKVTHVHYKGEKIGSITKLMPTGKTQNVRTGKIGRATLGGYPGEFATQYKSSDGHVWNKKDHAVQSVRDAHSDKLVYKRQMAKEETEIDEAMFPGTKEYEKKYGESPQQKLKKKGDTVSTAQGEMKKTEKGVQHSRRFSEMISAYQEQGLKYISELSVEEQASQEEYEKEVNKAKNKSVGKEKADVAKAYVQAVKNEEYEIIDANEINGVRFATIEERSLTEPEMKKKEEMVKGMKKGMSGFKQRYGDRAKEVMYATATARAKGE
jgi:hypothetical protein